VTARINGLVSRHADDDAYVVTIKTDHMHGEIDWDAKKQLVHVHMTRADMLDLEGAICEAVREVDK
jgi:hypothetical protein